MPGQSARENGKRGGRPKGKKSAKTLEREQVLKAFRERVMRSADMLANAQLTLAKGQTYLYKITKTWVPSPSGKGGFYRNNKPRIVEEPGEIESYLEGRVSSGDVDDDSDPGATYYFITTKEPNNQAIDSLLDRSLGKSAIAIGGLNGEPLFDNANKEKADAAIAIFLTGNS